MRLSCQTLKDIDMADNYLKILVPVLINFPFMGKYPACSIPKSGRHPARRTVMIQENDCSRLSTINILNFLARRQRFLFLEGGQFFDTGSAGVRTFRYEKNCAVFAAALGIRPRSYRFRGCSLEL
jgi:hypothetical protein